MSNAAQPTRNCHQSATLQARRLAAVASMTVMMLALMAADAAHEQATAEPPTISIAATILAESPGQVALPIRVGPASSIPRNSFLTVRGLPSIAALSEGYAIAPGSWAVPLSALPDLKIKLPVGLTGRVDIVVALVAKDGAVLFEAKSALVLGAVAPASAQAQSDPPAPKVGAGGAPLALPSEASRSVILPQDRERALKFLKKGDEEMAAGLVTPARLLYERAAELGLAQAAMALAATYDAAELTRPHFRGVHPDANEARRWYERARQLGAGDADQRLQRLGAK